MHFFDFFLIGLGINYVFLSVLLVVAAISFIIFILSCNEVNEINKLVYHINYKKAFNTKFSKAIFIFSFVIYLFLISMTLYFYFANVTVKELKRFIDKGYLNSGASEILIEEISNYPEKITYSMLKSSIDKDIENKKKTEEYIKIKKTIEFLKTNKNN